MQKCNAMLNFINIYFLLQKKIYKFVPLVLMNRNDTNSIMTGCVKVWFACQTCQPMRSANIKNYKKI